LWEFEVYGGSTPVPTNTPVPPTKTNTPVVADPTAPPQPTKTNTPVTGNNGTPYTGTAVNLPGKVEVENYNKGGEGVAFHDVDTANNGNAYRISEGVDIETCTDTGCGFDMGWTAAGEWEKYSVNVVTAGTYTIDFRVASVSTAGTFHLEIDNVNVTGTLTVPNTAGWQTFATISKTGVNLTAGAHIARLVMDTAGANFNWFQVR
jgi:hypothetical protein